MIGNDIVDLNTAKVQSNWKRKGFLDKVFTDSEQAYIFNSDDSSSAVWQLWSMKESAYKVFVQQNQQSFFNPKKLECTVLGKTSGSVEVDGVRYSTIFRLNENFVHSFATLEEKNQECQQDTICFHLSDSSIKNQRFETYERLKLKISEENNLDSNQLSIRKNNWGVPELYHRNLRLNIAFSLSHHGNYGAISILKNK